MINPSRFDVNQARQFIELLHGDADANVCWQVFHDSETSADTYKQPTTFHATLEDATEFLTAVQQYNYGVYCTLNKTDGKGRELENIRGYSYVFADFDNKEIGDLPLEPHLITARDATHSHCYWRVHGMVTDDTFKRCQKLAAVYLETDRQVFDPSRVVRVAGSLNCKNHAAPLMYNIIKIRDDKTPYTLDEFETAFALTGDKLTDFDNWCETKHALMEGDGYNDLPIYRERFIKWLKYQAEPAVKGNGRSYMVIRATGMGRDLGIPLSEAQQLVWEHYNDRIMPPYTEQERIPKLYKYVERAYYYGNNEIGSRTAASKFLRECGEVPEPTGGWEHNKSLKTKVKDGTRRKYKREVYIKLPLEEQYCTFEKCLNALKESPQNEQIFEICLKFIATAKLLKAEEFKRLLCNITGLGIKEINAHLRIFNKENKRKSMTHGDIAKEYIEYCSSQKMVSSDGSLWVYDNREQIYKSKSLSQIGNEVYELFNEENRCSRASDYKSISGLIYDNHEDQLFFNTCSKGISTPDGTYLIVDREVKLKIPSPNYRMRYKLNYSPDFKKEPSKFLQIFKHAFGDTYNDQIRQLQQFMGLAIFGLQFETQKALFLKGAAGSGKSTLLKILERLVPREYISNISPLEFDCDYKKANLAGKLLNLVPEISRDKPIPSDYFKGIISSDTISARQPYGKVFAFSPNSGNWFNGNFFMTTKDQSDGFYRRWAVLDFIHSKEEKKRDPKLLDKVCNEELSSIVGWLIQGVKDYLANGLYLSNQHDKCIQEWKTESNSVIGWLNDADSGILFIKDTKLEKPITVKIAYDYYKNWCSNGGRKPYGKQLFKDLMCKEGHSSIVRHGYVIYPLIGAKKPSPI